MFYSSSLFTNSNWFTFDGDGGINDRLAASVPSSSPNSEEPSVNTEETDEVLIGEATGIESQLESVSFENGPVEETEETPEVVKRTDSSTDNEKLLRTEEENVPKEAKASERHLDVQDGQADTQAEDAAQASCGEIGTERTVDEPASSYEPDNASPGASPDSGDIDNQSAGPADSNQQIAHGSGTGLQVKEDSPVEVDENETDEPTTNE